MNALRIVFLVLAVGLLGVFGWRLAAPRVAVVKVVPTTAAEPVAIVAPPSPASLSPEQRLAEIPEFASFYGRLKIDFPRDYAAFLGRLSGNGVSGGSNAAIWDAIRDLQQAQGILAARAGGPVLDRLFDARLAVLEGLAPLNARDCVDFLYGLTDASIADFTAAHRGLVATLADRTLTAIEDGRAQHRERVAPTPADLDALTVGLVARGVTPVETGVLIDGTTPDPPLPDARLCAIGRTYLDVLHGLPAEARQRIYGLAAELLARS